MSTYAIGDIQGCFRTLEKLLGRIAFDPKQDRLWLVGDLVNRGPLSLEVLRWARGLGDSLIAVLGNHDLHLLARAAGVTEAKRRDTLEEILHAPDRQRLLDWLGSWPLLHREGEHALVHAGLNPTWDLDEAEALAREAEAALQGRHSRLALATLSADKPLRWDPSLGGMARIQAILLILTRIRICRQDGTLDFDFKGEPKLAPDGFFPWFDISERRSAAATLVFGHWASLGLRLRPGTLALDTGCVYGKELTAVRLEDRRVFQQACLDSSES